ncbi:ricin-type beta-trefoil lectin domain protein [Umezawaea sp. Da 62-37]|uniref:ricin-type beta-trefoil lectin domain protein n=1 Tax=Umezawaea sp. Da 62-37 TaxID=3075927 RepID=UPI0028F6F75A|nr:ricin-type beta-trefoil lectin domain protein [Umezawaea sp. Da 62-37]WNV82513.1 ricin-type beta-trefoil lectin domain protein [Umezawaea sp. Da 62-37]
MPKSSPRRSLLSALGAALLATAAVAAPNAPAQAAGEQVNVWLTTTNSANRGTEVTRGLQQQTPVAFAAGTGTGGQTINVNENTRYQTFEGGGASFTDSAAWLMNSSGILSAATREDTMKKLFDPVNGIGLSMTRNPMASTDLARFDYSYDDTCCDVNDFKIDHDLADVLPLTKRAKELNPALRVMASPWSAPAWMKDNNSMRQGWLKAEYYATYGQYFAKYVQAYQSRGIPIDYVTPQNEPGCCAGYPSMQWNTAGLINFTKNGIYPAFRAAGINTKVLIYDWNWDGYNTWVKPQLQDPAIVNDPLFGGIAWHGYVGDVSAQTTAHNEFPNVKAFDTEHSGGTWITDQHREDMANIIDYTRNWGSSVVKWSLALDEQMNPHNGGCGTCTGFITVHNNDSRRGQVDYTVEYYTMGHLTKFVKPGAQRIESSDNASVKNVAWRNTDGSKALIAYNTTGSTQNVKVNWGGSSFNYSLPARTSATFTWNGTQGGTPTPTGGTITGLGGKCLDIAGASSTNGTAVQLYDCNGSTAQKWTAGTDGTLRALGKCLDIKDNGTADGTKLQIWDCAGGNNQKWTATAGKDIVNPTLNKCLDATGNSSANGTLVQIWACTGATNQKWTVTA